MRSTRLLIGVLSIAMMLTAAAHATLLLRSGDRVVFYGDSITEQRMYTRFFQQYLDCRYPELTLQFCNAGWGGDTAGGALKRLERDVLPFRPMVVLLCFGMNDGGYASVNDGRVANYRSNMDGLIKALQAKNIFVIVASPGCIDPDQQQRLRDVEYNAMLETLGNTARELAQQYKCAFIDLYHPMLQYQTQKKALDAKFTMIPDAVHPNAEGQMVMAATLLQGLTAEPMPPLGACSLSDNTGDGLRIISQSAEKIVIETTRPAAVPFWFDTSAAGAMVSPGFLDMAGQKLIVRNLPEATYRVYINDIDVGRYTKAQLAAGVLISGVYSQRGKLLHDLVMRKENAYYTTWREIRLGLADAPGIDKVVDSMMNADSQFATCIEAAKQPGNDPMRIMLVAVPTGENLALMQPYTCSDPNSYGWGIGKLTDGSWDENAEHCFATGAVDAFPKTATIDLGAVKKVQAVIAGVPNFGSTRTIKVAVSVDGKQFTEVGVYQFSTRKSERHIYRFPATDARYVQLIYPDHADEEVGYSRMFSFTTEAEVYGP